MLLPLQLNNLLGDATAPVFSGPIPNLRERQNSGTHQLDTSDYFFGADTYSIAPALEAGWSFDTNTGVLTFDTDEVGTFGTYVVTATNAQGDTESNAFSVEVFVASAGGIARHRRHRYFVTIDGQDFDVDSPTEAVQLLDKAKSIAQEVASDLVTRQTKRIRRGKQPAAVSPPVITSSPELEPVVSAYRGDIEAIYRQIAIDAELRELMRVKLLEEDDEEAIFVLLH